MRPLADREKTLAIVGTGLVLGIAFYSYRIQPLTKELTRARAEVVARRAKPPAPAPPPEAGRSVEELEDLVEKHRTTVARLETARGRDEASLLSAISALAARSSVYVRESAPVAAESADTLPNRGRRKLTVITQFGGLRAFIAGLAALPGGPVHLEKLDVSSVEVRVPDAAATEAPRVLLVTMVLVP